MIPMLPPLQLPWQHRPLRKVAWSPPISRPAVRSGRCCWNCGRPNVSFCEQACRNHAATAGKS